MKKLLKLYVDFNPLIFYIIVTCVLLVFFSFKSGSAQSLDPSEEKLNQNYDRILDYEYTTYEEKEIVSYVYPDKAIDDTNIIYTNDLSNIEKITESRFKIYTGIQFAKIDGFGYTLEYATSTREYFDLLRNSKLIGKKKFRIFNYANAQTSYPPYVGDGYVDRTVTNSVWSDLVTGNGTTNNYTGASTHFWNFQAHTISNRWNYNIRTILPFGIINVPENNEIIDADLNVYMLDASTGLSATGAIYEVNPAASSTLSNSDYQTFTSTRYSEIINQPFTTSGYTSLALNAAGRAYLNTRINNTAYLGMRNKNYDGDNVAPSWSSGVSSYIRFYTIEQTGTDKDPYLEITFASTTPEEEPTTLTEITWENDISKITGWIYTYSTTTGATTTINQIVLSIPFLTWVVITVLVIFIGQRLIIEFLIRWRKKSPESNL